MTRISIVPTLLALTLAANAADVIVYGGTSAGVMASVQAARMGRSVVLVAPEKHIGGMPVEGLGNADINNHWFRNDVAVGGLARDFYLRTGRKYGHPGPAYKYESHKAEAVFDDILRESGVVVERGQRLREPLTGSVEWAPGTRAIRAILTESGKRYEGRVFIDASIEGDLLAAAGVQTTSGREANAKYDETKNGVRAETTHAQFKVKVDPYRMPGDVSSGLIPTIQDEPLGTPGDGDSNIQAFCFRLCLTKNPTNRLPITKPEDFDRGRYEIYFRYARAGGSLWKPVANLPNGKTDLGSWHDLSANLYGMNREYPNGSHATRERIYREHLSFTHGLLWLLANDPEIPEATRAAWREWGLCKDEFTDNGGWPRQLYIRDARRMVSEFVMTEHHTRRINPEPVSDPVAVAFWPTDTHSVRRIVREGAAYNEGFVFDDNNWGPFGISYRSLTPRRTEATNLLTPTCPSSSHVAYGAIRLEQTFMSLGQAVGAAAVLAMTSGIAVQDVDYSTLRDRLVREGQIVSLSMVPAKESVSK
ncbi:MAG TPA: FAD-dependent oxidoreductase [Bryobacteraceae bacterium]|nr:FAD-dependent oxidoreductase [Bryobacteraceae bacterium]